MKETIIYKGYKINVTLDSYPDNPREWSNLGVMVCAHPRYILGDVQCRNGYEVDEYLKEQGDILVAYNLYLYDHGDITISVRPFSCPWDSGQVGVIFATKEQVRREYNVKRITARIKGIVKQVLQSEVKVYDDYLRGDVWNYDIETPDGDFLDACSGFYGDIKTSGLLDQAHAEIDFDIKERQEKAWISLAAAEMQFCE